MTTELDVPEACAAPPSRPPIAAMAGLSVAAIATIAFAALQYLMPRGIPSRWGLNPAGAEQWTRQLWHAAPAHIGAAAYLAGFWICLAVAGAGYVAALRALHAAGPAPAGRLPAAILALAVAVALLGPPTLSIDSYVYLAYAHIDALYSVNPYSHLPGAILAAHGDPVGRFLVWDFPCSYGPIWSLLARGIVSLVGRVPLVWQDMAMKLVEALALAGCALLGGRIAERVEPGRGRLATAAIGLNPLFLIEGPLSGHNDFLMLLALLGAVWAYLSGKGWRACLLLGLAAGIKLIPLAAVPWLAVALARGRGAMGDAVAAPEKSPPAQKRSALRPMAVAVAAALLCLLPAALALLPYWAGSATLNGLHGRSVAGIAAEIDPSTVPLGHVLLSAGLSAARVRALAPLLVQWPTIAIWLLLTGYLVQPRRGELAWLTGWIVLTLAMNLVFVGLIFPWYFAWPALPSLICWDRRSVRLSVISLALGVAFTAFYVAL